MHSRRSHIRIMLNSCWLAVLLLIFCLCSAIATANLCRSTCLCENDVIDCSHSKLATLPNLWSQSGVSVVNLSSNSLTVLDSLRNLPRSQNNLDLSFNQIASVSINVFSDEQCLELRTLNLSNNLISEAEFVLPDALQVLKLNRNQLQRFCVERLKNLSNLRILSLDFNGLKSLSCDKGGKKSAKKQGQPKTCPFSPLQRIIEVSIRGNRLDTLDSAEVHCFHNTIFLSLADNAIKSLSGKVLRSFQKLKYLDLSGNKLSHLPEDVFHQLPSLKFLSLAKNQLVSVPSRLPMLEWLDLSHNAIASVPESLKRTLYPQEVFLLGNNPLHCDCDLLWLKELYDTREYLLKYIDVEQGRFIPVCASPESMQGESWDVLGDSTFGCQSGTEDKVGGSSAGNSEKVAVVRVEDLSFNVRDIGATHIRLEWDSHSAADEKVKEGKEPRKAFISCHPFGQKNLKMSKAVQLSVGTHRLIGLQPSTAYVVCISLADSSAGSVQGQSTREDCVEVLTLDDENFQLRDIYTRISVVVVVFMLLMVKCCCMSGQQKEISARRKDN